MTPPHRDRTLAYKALIMAHSLSWRSSILLLSRHEFID